MALQRFHYAISNRNLDNFRAKAEDKPFHNWLTHVFRLEDNQWRIIHDQNTALDFHVFVNQPDLVSKIFAAEKYL